MIGRIPQSRRLRQRNSIGLRFFGMRLGSILPELRQLLVQTYCSDAWKPVLPQKQMASPSPVILTIEVNFGVVRKPGLL